MKIGIAASILLVVVLLGFPVKAESPTPAMGQLRLFGRWDLRAADRAITVNGGSYILARFSGPTVNALFDLSLNKSPLPTLAWRIDGGTWQEGEVAAKMTLAEGLPSGPHRLQLMARGFDVDQGRWRSPLMASLTFLGLDLPGGQLLPALEDWDHPKLTIEFLGDSITEGVLVQPTRGTLPWKDDALGTYSCQTAMALGAQWRLVGFGAQGLQKNGSGGVPGALTTFNSFHDGCPRDGWQPDLVVVNQGTNDRMKVLPEQYEPLYVQYLKLIRQGYPNAKIVALRPFDGSEVGAIQQAIDQRHAAGDAQVYFIDTTGWYTGKALHPDAEASKPISARLTDALKATILK